MLGLAGIPATAGFIGKFYLIDAAVCGGYTWLGVVIVIGSMISLGYYLPGDRRDVDARGSRRRHPAADGPRHRPAGARGRLAGARRLPAGRRRARTEVAGAARPPPARGRLRGGPRAAPRRSSSGSSPSRCSTWSRTPARRSSGCSEPGRRRRSRQRPLKFYVLRRPSKATPGLASCSTSTASCTSARSRSMERTQALSAPARDRGACGCSRTRRPSSRQGRGRAAAGLWASMSPRPRCRHHLRPPPCATAWTAAIESVRLLVREALLEDLERAEAALGRAGAP